MIEKKPQGYRRWCRKDTAAFRVFVSEFFGTMFMVVVITCTACQVVLSGGRAGNMVTGFFGVVFGVTFAVYVSLKTSGAHINPIITIAMAIIGQTPRRLVIVYWIAQYIGAFIGAAIAYGIYYDAFNAFDHGNRTIFGESGTGHIFSSFPQYEHISIPTCVFDQLLSSAILIIGILTITDPSNMPLPPIFLPPMAGILVGLIVACMGYNCYAPLNPAKDFSSRIFMWIAGWGDEPFSYRGYTWFYLPLVIPHIGAVFGIFVYRVFIKSIITSKKTEPEELEVPPTVIGTPLSSLLDDKLELGSIS